MLNAFQVQINENGQCAISFRSFKNVCFKRIEKVKGVILIKRMLHNIAMDNLDIGKPVFGNSILRGLH